MHNLDTILILNVAFGSPCVFTHGVRKLMFFQDIIHQLRNQHLCFCQLLLYSSRPLQTTVKILEIPIARRKCLCASGKMFLWNTLSLESGSQCRIRSLGTMYIVRPVVNRRPREALWRRRETTEASSRAQILAWLTESTLVWGINRLAPPWGSQRREPQITKLLRM